MSMTSNNRMLFGLQKPNFGSPTHSNLYPRDTPGSPTAVNGFKNALKTRTNRSGSPSFDRGIAQRAPSNGGYKDLKQIQQTLFQSHRATPSIKGSSVAKQPTGPLARIQSTQNIDRHSPLSWVGPGSPRQGSPNASMRGSPQMTTKNELLHLLSVPDQNLPLLYYQNVPITKVCTSHPQRPSLYYVPETPEVLEFNRGRSLGYLRGVCQQCAVKMAFHKVLVEEIDRTEQIEENLRVVNDWSHGLQKALSFQQEALVIMTKKAQTFHQYCQQEFNYVQEFEGYINQFIYMMQTKLSQVKTQILECNQQESTRLDQYRLEIQANVSILTKLLADIEGQQHSLASENQPEEIAKLIANSERDLLDFRNNAWNRITSNFTLSGLERVEVEQIAESVKIAHEWFKIGKHDYSDNFQVKSLTQGLIKEALQPATTSRRSSSLRPLQDVTNLNQSQSSPKMDTQKHVAVDPEAREDFVKPLLSCNDFSFDKTEIWESMIGNDANTKSIEQDQYQNQPVLQDLDVKSAIMNTKEIENLIEGVSKSQANTSKYYQAYIPDEPIIVISPEDPVNPDQQTPELGEKLRPSAPLQEKLSQLLSSPSSGAFTRQHQAAHLTSPTQGVQHQHTTSTLLQQSELDSLFTYLGHQQAPAETNLGLGATLVGSADEHPQQQVHLSAHQQQLHATKGSSLSTVAGNSVSAAPTSFEGVNHALSGSGLDERRASGIKCQKILFLEGDGTASDPN